MFYIDYIDDKRVLKSDLLNDVEHFFTTRDLCIFSKKEDMSYNKMIVEKYIGQKLATNKPIHGVNIKKVNNREFIYEDCDGLIFERGTAGFMNFADCVPLFFYCDGVAMVSHAGWRGSAREIARISVNKLIEHYNCNRNNIKVVIGPAICKNCYEVGEDVFYKLYNTVKKHDDIFIKNNGKFYVDLKGINKQQLLEEGVENIDVCPYCTNCGEKMFYSYRYENTDYRHSLVVKV